ncbi:hypothetical protein H632_c1176p0 [Helicosporidium sp. ATCC 50920]|nr:hypothetical protein H632_c1176p0 [Helicosporidium sp. ATCC 50920]|eukprot:KDD74623.1 hypothetical protein H632_c1176p0 [Helicosporidium sp. ATCC 50920]
MASANALSSLLAYSDDDEPEGETLPESCSLDAPAAALVDGIPAGAKPVSFQLAPRVKKDLSTELDAFLAELESGGLIAPEASAGGRGAESSPHCAAFLARPDPASLSQARAHLAAVRASEIARAGDSRAGVEATTLSALFELFWSQQEAACAAGEASNAVSWPSVSRVLLQALDALESQAGPREAACVRKKRRFFSEEPPAAEASEAAAAVEIGASSEPEASQNAAADGAEVADLGVHRGANSPQAAESSRDPAWESEPDSSGAALPPEVGAFVPALPPDVGAFVPALPQEELSVQQDGSWQPPDRESVQQADFAETQPLTQPSTQPQAPARKPKSRPLKRGAAALIQKWQAASEAAEREELLAEPSWAERGGAGTWAELRRARQAQEAASERNANLTPLGEDWRIKQQGTAAGGGDGGRPPRSEEALPDGWQAITDPRTNCVYYAHAASAGRDDSVQVAIEPSVAWDDEIDQLRAGVSRLKQENVMEAARLTLRQAMKRLDRAYKQSKSNHMIYLFVFALAMFFAVFFWSKVYRFFKWIL